VGYPYFHAESYLLIIAGVNASNQQLHQPAPDSSLEPISCTNTTAKSLSTNFVNGIWAGVGHSREPVTKFGTRVIHRMVVVVVAM